MSISLCMIVKDEADVLPRCLESVRGWVDEMIVLDTGSEDNSPAIAQQMGADVAQIEWTQDFAVARNQALERATGDWILVLDADETLTPAGQQLLHQVRTGDTLGEHPLHSVILVTLLRHEINTDQTPYSAVSRLFRNRPDVRFQRPYHETVDDSIAAVTVAAPQWRTVLWPHVALDHSGYTAAAIARRSKFARARTIMVAYLADHPNDAYICNKLGALYGAEGDWQTGQRYLEQGLAANQDDPCTAYELHYHLGLASRTQQQWDRATAHYTKALAQPIPEVMKVGAYINLGSLRQAQKDFLGAVEQFEKATQVAPQFAIAHFNLGTAQRARGNLTAAISAYAEAIALNSDYGEAYQNLGVALFKLGQLPESMQAFQRAISIYQKTDPAAAQRLQQGIRNLGVSR